MKVVWPENDALVPADSFRVVIVEAEGSVTAMELYLTRSAISDTAVKQRREFDEELLSVEEEFVVRIPFFRTGTQIEIRAAVEDLLGLKHLSERVVVQVIDCDRSPFACEGI